MKELSLNILDISQNSVKAGATLTEILLEEDGERLVFTITDDGCGMKPEFLARVTDPFTTTRTTRRVGLGLPLLKMEAELTGGSLTIASRHKDTCTDHGTTVRAVFCKNSIDFIPLGDIVASLCVLIQGMGEMNLSFRHVLPEGEVALDTREMRAVLGDVSLGCPEVIEWVRESLSEQYEALHYTIIRME